MQLTAADFFAGGGLATEGLRRHFRVVWANDISAEKAAVYCANHPQTAFHHGDVRELTARDVPPHMVSWASFPCQDVSLAGNVRSIRGERSSLVLHWLQMIGTMRPRPPVIVAENVMGLIRLAGGAHYGVVHRAMADHGYRVGAVVLDAQHWVPQSRTRVFMIGVRADVRTARWEQPGPGWCHPPTLCRAARTVEGFVWWALPKPDPRRVGLSHLLEADVPFYPPERTAWYLRSLTTAQRERIRAGVAAGLRVFASVAQGKGVQLCVRYDDVAYCLTARQGGNGTPCLIFADAQDANVLHTRYPTVRECARLMGLPEHYQLPTTRSVGYRVLGDGVVVPVVQYLAQHLLVPLARAAQR